MSFRDSCYKFYLYSNQMGIEWASSFCEDDESFILFDSITTESGPEILYAAQQLEYMGADDSICLITLINRNYVR